MPAINKVTAQDVKDFVASPAINTYQNRACKSAHYPGKGMFIGTLYLGLKLGGEAGEVGQDIAKAMRDDAYGADGGIRDAQGKPTMTPLTPIRRLKIIEEMGDTLWYLAALSAEMGVTLEEVATLNLQKLAVRDGETATRLTN